MNAPSPSPAYMTPSNAPNNRHAMRPLPLRVATGQYVRLCSARDRTGISIQEHVRRAIDAYLAGSEREAIELGHLPVSPSGRKAAAPKVVKR